MAEDSPPTRTPVSLWLLVSAIVAAGLVVLAAGLAPTHWLMSIAERIGHADHATPERLVRLRGVSLLLAAGNLVLTCLLSTVLRSATSRALAALSVELTSARPAPALSRAWAFVREPGWFHVIVLAIVFVTGAGIRLRYLDVPIDYDEAYSFLNYARRPLAEALSDYNSTNNHLLNTLCMHAAYKLFGAREWALRLHVLVAGVALIVVTYSLGRRLSGPHVALVAAALVATSFMLVNYSVNARGYVWVAWMSVILAAAFFRVATAPSGPLVADWVGSWLAASVGLFAAPIMIYPIVGCAAWLATWTLAKEKRAWPQLVALAWWVGAVMLTVAWLYAPAIVYRGFEAWRHPFVSAIPLGALYSRTMAAWNFALASWAEGPTIAQIPVIFAALAVWSLLLGNRRALGLLLSILLATTLMMAAQRVAPPPRIFSFLAPFFAIVAANGVVTILGGVVVVLGVLRGRRPSAAAEVVCTLLACGICVWGGWNAYRDPLPGGERPSFLIEDVGQHNAAEWARRRAMPPTQLWRLDVEPLARLLHAELCAGDRLLVALPADLPLHFHAFRLNWTTPIGGQPQPGERLFLVAPLSRHAADVLSDNPSLQFTDPKILRADWRVWASLGELTIWQASPLAPAPTE